MALRLIFGAIIAFVLAMTILQQSIWGGMGLRKGAIVAFIGFSLLSASIILGTLGYLILELGWKDVYAPIILLSPILLGLSILGASGLYVCRRSLQGRRRRTPPGVDTWIDYGGDIPEG
jgi:hypothetical protein